jgi:hypothetical protein
MLKSITSVWTRAGPRGKRPILKTVASVFASIGLVTAPMGIASAQMRTISTEITPVDTDQVNPPGWIPANDAEIDEATGGWFWVVVVGGLRATNFVIKTCGKDIRACTGAGQMVFNSASAARNWVCRKYGRLC